MVIFLVILAIVVIQRLIELVIAKSNEKYLLSIGGKEFGAGHYKYIVIMHALFFVSLILEFTWRGDYNLHLFSYPFLVIFALLQFVRIWVIKSLGKFWNTKIIVVPGSQLVRTGPYKYLKHPNYMVVALEMFTLPMIFELYYTAIVFTILNLIVLLVRIKEENKALLHCRMKSD